VIADSEIPQIRGKNRQNHQKHHYVAGFGVAVTAFVTSRQLSYVEPG